METSKYLLTEGKAHLSIRNIIANEYGISKEFAEKMVERRAEEVVRQFLAKADGLDFLEKIIKKTVMGFINSGVDGDERWSNKQTFESYIKDITTQTVKEHIISTYDFKIERK